MLYRVQYSTKEVLPSADNGDTLAAATLETVSVQFVKDDQTTPMLLPAGQTLVWDAKPPSALNAATPVITAGAFILRSDLSGIYDATVDTSVAPAMAAIANATSPVPLSGQFATYAPNAVYPTWRSQRYPLLLDNVVRQPGDLPPPNSGAPYPPASNVATVVALNAETARAMAAEALAEPGLGNPTASGYLLSSTAAGGRSWIPAPASGVTSVNGQTGAVSAATSAQGALAATAEQPVNKGTANGYAPLDGTAKVPAAFLPSYVDDVLEVATASALPATGETGKIYVALDTNLEYRWSGSTYVQLVKSPGSTDALAEGAANLYFTAGRVQSVGDGRYDAKLTAVSTPYVAIITPAVGTAGAINVLNVGTLTGPLTVAAPTGAPADGQVLKLRFTQDATGGRAVTYDPAFVFTKANPAASFPTGANARYAVIFEFWSLDAKWHAEGVAGPY